MPDDLQRLVGLVDSVKSGMQQICSLLDQRPELAGGLTVEDYFLIVDLTRMLECYGCRS